MLFSALLTRPLHATTDHVLDLLLSAADFSIRLISQGASLGEIEKSLSSSFDDFEVRSLATEAIIEDRVDVLSLVEREFGLLGDALETHFSLISLTAWATNNGELDCLKFLLESGASTEAGDGRSVPPFLAAQRGDLPAIKLLHSFGVNFKPPRNDLIRRFGSDECAQFYADCGGCGEHEILVVLNLHPSVQVPLDERLIDLALSFRDLSLIANLMRPWYQRGILPLQLITNGSAR